MSTTRLAGVLLAFAVMVIAVPAWAAPGSTDQIKAQFDEAMSQPLAERVGSLQELDEEMGQALAEVTSVKERAYIHKLRYRSRRGLGRYEAAHQSFAEFASAMRRWDEQRAQRAVPEFVQKRLSPGQRGEVVALADAALASWAGHDQAAPALLYLKAKALSRMANRAGEALRQLHEEARQDVSRRQGARHCQSRAIDSRLCVRHGEGGGVNGTAPRAQRCKGLFRS